jgi:hypothetical protein
MAERISGSSRMEAGTWFSVLAVLRGVAESVSRYPVYLQLI